MGRRAGLAVPGRERVPKIVSAEIRDGRPFKRLAPGQRADLEDGFTPEGEHPRCVPAMQLAQDGQGHLVQGHRMWLAVFCAGWPGSRGAFGRGRRTATPGTRRSLAAALSPPRTAPCRRRSAENEGHALVPLARIHAPEDIRGGVSDAHDLSGVCHAASRGWRDAAFGVETLDAGSLGHQTLAVT